MEFLSGIMETLLGIGILGVVFTVLIIGFLIFLGIVQLFLNVRRQKDADAYSPDPHYDARFASEQELERAGAFKQRPGGIPIGLWGKKKTISHNPQRGKLKGHVVFGSMGSFKTSSKMTPEQVWWPGALVDFTATAESAASTADYRRRFGLVYQINPNHDFWEHLKHIPEIRINPMDRYWLDPAKLLTFGTRASGVALAAIPNEDTREKFWDRSTRSWAKLIIMGECELNPRNANIARVASIMHQDPVDYTKWLARKTSNKDLRTMCQRYIPVGDEDPRSIHEVRQNSCAHLASFMSAGVAGSLSRAEVMLGRLRQMTMTIIVVNSLEHLGADDTDHFRTFVLEALLAEVQSDQFAGNVELCIQIDELGQYPRLESVLRGQSSLRKYNAYLSCAINDYATLARIYGDEGCQTFINNGGLVQFMSPIRDDKGVRFLCRALGEREVYSVNKSWGEPYPGSGGHRTVNTSASQAHRPVLTEEEIRRLPPGTQIVWMDGVERPVFCNVRPYFKTEDVKLVKPNIYYR